MYQIFIGKDSKIKGRYMDLWASTGSMRKARGAHLHLETQLRYIHSFISNLCFYKVELNNEEFIIWLEIKIYYKMLLLNEIYFLILKQREQSLICILANKFTVSH